MARKPLIPNHTEEEMLEALAKHGDDRVSYYNTIKSDWDYWKDYKWCSHKDRYALPRTEAFAIETLFQLGNGDPFLSAKIIDWNAQQNRKGLFRPSDLFLWSSWQRELEVPKVEPMVQHKFLADREGWPVRAFADPRWCSENSAETYDEPGSYETYLSETVAFFGPLKAGNYLKEQDWDCWRNQVAPFDFGINPRDFASLAMKRIELHIKFHQAHEVSLKGFMLRHKPELV